MIASTDQLKTKTLKNGLNLFHLFVFLKHRKTGILAFHGADNSTTYMLWLAQ